MAPVGLRIARVPAVVVSAAIAILTGCKASSDAGSCADCGEAPVPSVCNGHAELCTRSYDAVAFPGTHDAYSNIAQGFVAPDQSYPIARQLEDGVRALHLEIKPHQDDVYLCHGPCEFGATLLSDALTDVNRFIQGHPTEVVTLLTESSDVTTDLIGAAAQKSGLDKALHVQARGQPWPTLSAMIRSRKRVVVFHADFSLTGGVAYPWLHDRFTWTWETPWDNSVPQDFVRCNADRGSMGKGLYVVDVYREDQLIPSLTQAQPVNMNPFLLGRIRHCQQATRTFPNFVMVNYYQVGDLFRDIDILNGLSSGSEVDAGSFPPIASWPDAAQ